MIVIELKEFHFMLAVRTFQWIIAKGKKDRCSPLVKAAKNRLFFFGYGAVQFGIYLAVPGIKATVPDHFKMLFRDMPDQPLDELHSRNCFFHILIVFMPVIVEGNHISIIFINTGSSNNRAAKVTSDVFHNGIRVTFIGFGINIKTMFVVSIAFRFYFFKRRSDFGFQLVKKRGTEGIAKVGIMKVFDISPEAVITISAFRNQTMDMGIPFQIPAKSMQYHDKTRSKVFGFIHLKKHT